MKAGWVTFCTKKYSELAQVLVESLSVFSKYPVEIFTSDFDFPVKIPGKVMNRRMDIGTENLIDIYYAQNLRCGISTQFEACVVIDCDSVANINCDDLIKTAMNHTAAYTLHAGHGCDPNNQQATMDYMGVKEKSMPYVYATHISSDTSREFLRYCWDMAQKMREKNHVPANTGETLLNCALWKHGVKEQMNCWLPYIDVLPYYLNGDIENNPLHGYYQGKALSYQFFHGQKDASKAGAILSKLMAQDKSHFEKPWTSTSGCWRNTPPATRRF